MHEGLRINSQAIKDHDLEFKFSLGKVARDPEGNGVTPKHELDNQDIERCF